MFDMNQIEFEFIVGAQKAQHKMFSNFVIAIQLWSSL